MAEQTTTFRDEWLARVLKESKESSYASFAQRGPKTLHSFVSPYPDPEALREHRETLEKVHALNCMALDAEFRCAIYQGWKSDAEWNELALQDLGSGSNSLLLWMDENNDPEQALSRISYPHLLTGVRFSTETQLKAMEKMQDPPQSTHQHYFYWDHCPLSDSFCKTRSISADILLHTDHPHARSITIDAARFGKMGISPELEMALALSLGKTYLDMGVEMGLSPELMAQKLAFKFSIHHEVLVESAKFRVFRYLWASVLHAYTNRAVRFPAFMIAESNVLFQAEQDEYNNLLRTTLQCGIAMCSPVSALILHPFLADKGKQQLARHAVRNIPLILENESFLTDLQEPLAGGYLPDMFAIKMINATWNIFTNDMEQGLWNVKSKDGWIRNQIEMEMRQWVADVCEGKRPVIGVTHYPPGETTYRPVVEESGTDELPVITWQKNVES